MNEYFRAQAWDYGWREVVQTLETLDQRLPVVVDNARSEPYIELLFFKKYDPLVYQGQNKEVSVEEYYSKMERVRTVQIGNITTRGINWESDLGVEQYMVGDGLSISGDQINRHGLTLIKEIKFPDKTTAFRIVKINP